MHYEGNIEYKNYTVKGKPGIKNSDKMKCVDTVIKLIFSINYFYEESYVKGISDDQNINIHWTFLI